MTKDQHSLIPPAPSGYVADSIARLRSELLHLEHLCSGYYVTGGGAADLQDMARRLEALTLPNKGYLPGSARRLDDAA